MCLIKALRPILGLAVWFSVGGPVAHATVIYRLECDGALAGRPEGPDLARVKISITMPPAHYLRQMALSESWLIEAMRTSLREPYPTRSPIATPKFLLFLPTDAAQTRFVRVDTYWKSARNELVVTLLTPYAAPRDRHVVDDLVKVSRIRGLSRPLSATHAAVLGAAAQRISFENVFTAMDDAIASPVVIDETKGTLWVIGYAEGRPISVIFRRVGELIHVIEATLASADARGVFVTRKGLTSESPAQRLLTIKSGPFKGRHVAYGIGIEIKIERTHFLSRDEVTEAIERSRGLVAEEDEAQIKRAGLIPRKWFISHLKSGRYVKVVLVDQNNEVVLISAYDAVYRRYKYYLAQIAKFGSR